MGRLDRDLLYQVREMLRINVHVNEAETILVVEGKLVGPWVTELASCWHESVADSARVVVKLTAVSFIDEAGRKLLVEMHQLGTEITAEECLTRSIIEKITGAVAHRPAEC
jgi:ABC-type transporter Mla MlaB component